MLLLCVLSWRVSQAWSPHQLQQNTNQLILYARPCAFTASYLSVYATFFFLFLFLIFFITVTKRPPELHVQSGLGVGSFFYSLARIWGEDLTIHSPPALFFFFNGDQLEHTDFTFFRPESAHSGFASWDDCGRVFPKELCVSSFSLLVFHTMPGQYYQSIPTSLGQGCMRV